MPLDQVTANVDRVFDFMPMILGTFVLLWLVLHVLGPLLSSVGESRADARKLKAEKAARKDAVLAKAQARQSLLDSIAVLCSEYDDWLDTNILMLEIDCASNRSDIERAQLLMDLINAKRLVANTIIHFDNNPTVLVEDGDKRNIEQAWSVLKQKVNEMPPVSNAA